MVFTWIRTWGDFSVLFLISPLFQDSRESFCFKASSCSPQPINGGWGLRGSFIPHHSASDQHTWALETLPGVKFSRADFHFSGNKTLVLFVVIQKHGNTWKTQKKCQSGKYERWNCCLPLGKKKLASTFWHSPPGVFCVFSLYLFISISIERAMMHFQKEISFRLPQHLVLKEGANFLFEQKEDSLSV